MKLGIILVVFAKCCLAASNDENEEDANRNKIIEQMTRTRTIIMENYHLVTRQIATDVYMYRSYRTVSVIFFPVSRDVVDARFTFQAEELHMNNIGSCTPQEVIVNLKHGSYPAVNPDQYEFPKNFIDPATRELIHTIELKSDGQNNTYSIRNPKPGNWYALVYIKWEDPRLQKVEQQGLVAACETIFYTDLQVNRKDDIDLIDCYSELTIDYDDLPAYFKCVALDTTEDINLNITVKKTPNPYTYIKFRVQSLSIPTERDSIIDCAFDPKKNNEQSINFTPHPNAWHYITLDYISNATYIANCESYNQRAEDDTYNHTIIDLMRDDKGRFFTFQYGLPTTDLHDEASLVNITSSEIKTLRFRVNEFLDIGGNLALEASLLMSLKYYMGYKRETNDVFGKKLLAFTEEDPFFKVVICVGIDHPSVPQENGLCKYNDKIKPALFVLNSTDSDSIYDKVTIPFPDSGSWYITFRLFSDSVVCPCPTTNNGTKYYVKPDGKVYEDLDKFNDTVSKEDREVNATVVLSISSTSCVNGRCSNHGSCLLNTFGGHVMSFCSCTAGYGGWDCSDTSRMDSQVYMLVSVLFLTLSNLLFFISIYVAIIRLYYTEAMMYAFTMIFSTFYHACDAPVQVRYCIGRANILQFGDFYCGIMCFWVTLLAMSIMRDRVRSSLQLLGAIIIALLTTWNMHSIVAFLLPVAAGVTILLIAWYLDYYNTKKFRYPRSYYTRYLPAGLILVSVGLVCYAFLQTELNYRLVHSFWHMFIAASVIFLLPDVKREENLNPFLPSNNYCKIPRLKLFHRRSVGNN